MRRLSGVLVLVGLLVVACGGGDSNGGSASNSPAGAASNGGDIGGSIDSTRCQQAASALAAAAAAVPQAVTGTTGDLSQSLDQLQAITDAAPADIRADLQVVTDGYSRFAQILADANFDPGSGEVPTSEVLQQLTAAAAELDKTEFQTSAERVGAWFRDGCGS